MTVFIVSILIALSVSFLCSVMEAALLSITPSKLALISEKSPAAGRLCRKLKENIERPIAVILILNTAAHTFGAAIAGAQFDHLFGGEYIWLFSLIFTVAMVQYTEILPKTLGVRFNGAIIRGSSRTLYLLVKLMAPLIWLVHAVNRPFDPGAGEEDKLDQVCIEELEALTKMAQRSNRLSDKQAQEILQILDKA